jgi:hypothetical protein
VGNGGIISTSIKQRPTHMSSNGSSSKAQQAQTAKQSAFLS